MIDKIKELISEAQAFNAKTSQEIEDFRIKFLGKKGLLHPIWCIVSDPNFGNCGHTHSDLPTTRTKRST